MPALSKRARCVTLAICMVILLVPPILVVLVMPSANVVVVRYERSRLTTEDRAAINALETVFNRGGEICDPLPCWVVLNVKSIAVLDVSYSIEDSSPLLKPSDRVLLVENLAEPARTEGICPAGSRVVRAAFRDRWWSPSRSYLDGNRIVVCIVPSANATIKVMTKAARIATRTSFRADTGPLLR